MYPHQCDPLGPDSSVPFSLQDPAASISLANRTAAMGKFQRTSSLSQYTSVQHPKITSLKQAGQTGETIFSRSSRAAVCESAFFFLVAKSLTLAKSLALSFVCVACIRTSSQNANPHAQNRKSIWGQYHWIDSEIAQQTCWWR